MNNFPTANLLTRSLKNIWHPCTQMKHHALATHDSNDNLPLLPIARGEGAWLYSTDGRRWMDGISSWWVNLFGHCNPRINAAIIDQLERLEHVMLAGATHEPAVLLAERLSERTKNKLGHCFYASDGACATEIALKMSFHYWRNTHQPLKRKFLCLAGGYHGETLGALSVTDVPIFRDAYEPLLSTSTVLPAPNASHASDAIDALAAHLTAHHAETAALILEPLVQCAAGMIMHDAEYLRCARALCDKYAVHLICDEIAVGFGRTGTFFAHEQAGITPDFLCLSKGISAGYLPLSAVLTQEHIYQAFFDDATAQGFLHSHSYTGNALACRAALASLDIFDEDDILAKNRLRSDRINTQLAPLLTHPAVSNYRRCGMIFAFDVNSDAGFNRRFYRAALEREVLLRPIGNTVYLMPPYILTDEEIDFLCHATLNALKAAL
ncbi:MAG: adenosylmethionine--8-amino-7-oxononanoate transaminase [Rhodocyclaceae bacterium]|nr:adenosylmethionine--8-amino-7-oxononanoate transaminase [Rhodocyclaceae bacterium]